ncbi:MAG: hypothetical protein IJV04_04075 [Lachnospiraceae bacterium]|nr:hypothetical protein [Lachnospiraceae bacterium]
MIFIDTYYLIDYENVGSNGIDGCKGLKKTDHIHLFYTENAKKISLDFFEDHGEAELVIHKVPVRKQSLDMHLVSFLGYLIGMNTEPGIYRIVSKDTDYDNIIKFWKSEKQIEASRISSIKMANRVSKTRRAKEDAASKPAKTTSRSRASGTSAKGESARSTAAVSGKASASRELASKFADTDNRTRLNNEVQQVLSKEGGYTSEVVCDVAKLSVGLIGEEHFQQRVHNELQSRYDNYSDIYTLIKPILDQCVARQTTESSGRAEESRTLKEGTAKASSGQSGKEAPKTRRGRLKKEDADRTEEVSAEETPKKAEPDRSEEAQKKAGLDRSEEAPAEEAPKKRRGRSKKEDADKPDAEEAPKKAGRPKKRDADRTEETPAEEAPRKRGRPKKQASNEMVEDVREVDRTELNSMVQKTLSSVGLPPEEIGFVASTVVKNSTEKNGKQMTYRAIISRFGKKHGLEIYRTVKGHIPY